MSIHIPDRHSPEPAPAPAPEAPEPPVASAAPASDRTTAAPRQRSPRLVVALVVGAVVLVGGLAALLALLARNGVIGTVGLSYQEDFESSDVEFELVDDSRGHAFPQDGTLVVESSVGDVLAQVEVGAMARATTDVDVAPGETTYAGPAIGGPYEPGPGWYVAALVADSGEFFIVDSDHGFLAAARDVVLPGPWTTVSLSMEYSADRTQQVFTAVVMERVGPDRWVRVPETEVSATLAAREAATVYALVGPAGGPRNDDGTTRTARAAFDDWSTTYDRSD